MGLKFENLDDFMNDAKVKLLIYGKSGAGKTTLLASSVIPNLTKGYKTLIILTEANGKLAIANARKRNVWNKESKVVFVSSLEDLKNILDFLKANPNEFDLVGLDSLDDLENIIKTSLLAKKPNKEVLTQQDWQILISKMRNIVDSFRRLDTHLVILAHPTVKIINEEEKVTHPAVAGRNQPDVIAGMFNAVGYLHKSNEAGTIKRKVIFQGNDDLLTKELPELLPVEEPWIPLWIDKIKGVVSREYKMKEYMEFLKTSNKKGAKK